MLFIGKAPWLTFLCLHLQPLSSKEPECSFSIHLTPLLKTFYWLWFYLEQTCTTGDLPGVTRTCRAHSWFTAVTLQEWMLFLQRSAWMISSLLSRRWKYHLPSGALVSHLPLLCIFLVCLFIFLLATNTSARKWHRPGNDTHGFLSHRWERSHMNAPKCKGTWDSCVPRKIGNRTLVDS